ncbi:MAG: ATP-binding protein [bacterium]|jgi:predicted ATPase with chaperone activity
MSLAMDNTIAYRPQAPKAIEETGLTPDFISDLILKTLFYRGTLNGGAIASELKLPYATVVQAILRNLRESTFVEVRHGSTFQDISWDNSLTERGRHRVAEVLGRDMYLGPAPVPLDQYLEVTSKQRFETQQINEAMVREALSDLVINDHTISQLGPAMNSGRSIFLFGAAGNGKTIVAERLSRTIAGGVMVPYAVEADNQVIKVFDPLQHKAIEQEENFANDNRWVACRRPFIVVGGELTMENLDLMYDSHLKYYTAPFQLKANAGMLLIDDFGRQRVSPQDLLNRWIVPLEKGIDFYTLITGKQVVVPFDLLIVYSTNLDPKDLVDEAFLRRIRYKIEIGDPSEEEFREIFRRVCETKSIPLRREMLDYLIQRHFREAGRPMRAVHPRDILEQLMDIAHYLNKTPEMTEELLDHACATYFTKM